MSQIDPKLSFKVGPVNGREARQSGHWLKAWVAEAVVAERHKSEGSARRAARERGLRR